MWGYLTTHKVLLWYMSHSPAMITPKAVAQLLQVCHWVICDCRGPIALNPLLACSLVGGGQVFDATWCLEGALPLSCRQCGTHALSAAIIQVGQGLKGMSPGSHNMSLHVRMSAGITHVVRAILHYAFAHCTAALNSTVLHGTLAGTPHNTTPLLWQSKPVWHVPTAPHLHASGRGRVLPVHHPLSCAGPPGW